MAGEEGHVDYGEGVFVGYRYYDTFRKQVTYPFGYGLSYATFDVHDATVAKTGPRSAEVTVTVTNTSDVAGAETVQVYVAPPKAKVARPVHELKGFAKVALEPGESKSITIALDDRAFAYWSERFDDWHVEGGTYTVEVGVSSRDIVSRIGRRDRRRRQDHEPRRMVDLRRMARRSDRRADPAARARRHGQGGRSPRSSRTAR